MCVSEFSAVSARVSVFMWVRRRYRKAIKIRLLRPSLFILSLLLLTLYPSAKLNDSSCARSSTLDQRYPLTILSPLDSTKILGLIRHKKPSLSGLDYFSNVR